MKDILIIHVDVQDDYRNESGFNYRYLHNWINYVNSNIDYNQLFLFNGESLGYDLNESSYKDYLFEYGVNQEIIDKSDYFDKGYGFFRDLMDEGYTDEVITIGKYLLENNLTDCRDIDEDTLKELVDLDFGFYMGLPDLTDLLIEYKSKYDKAILTGGGKDECLFEVQLLMDILDFKFETTHDLVY